MTYVLALIVVVVIERLLAERKAGREDDRDRATRALIEDERNE